MKPIYSDDSYASSRLRNSLVMRNNKPYFIKAVGVGGQVIGTPLTGNREDIDKDEESVFSFEQGYTLDTIPLGFMNGRGSCTYLARAPSKRS